MWTRQHSRRSVSLFVSALAFAAPCGAQGLTLNQDFCVLPDSASSSGASTPSGLPELRFPNHGTINALIVFVQNQTDTSPDNCFDPTRRNAANDDFYSYPPGPDGVTPCTGVEDTPTVQSTTDDPVTEWPVTRSREADRLLPQWADDLLAAPGTDPAYFEDGSLSQYYHLNSGSRFALTGYVYPEVYIPAESPTSYRANPGRLPNGGVRLSREILSYVDTHREGIPLDSTALFDRYVNGTNVTVGDPRFRPDGVFDMVIFVFRTNNLCDYGVNIDPVTMQCGGGNGITSLGSSGEASVPSSYNAFADYPVFLGDLEVTDNLTSGSGVWAVGESRFLGQTTIAHEIGHRQFWLAHSTPKNALSIMLGRANHPTMFSGPDRLQLGWAVADTVNYDGLVTGTRTIDETFTSGRLLYVQNDRNAPNDRPSGDHIVEARTRSNVWDRMAGPTNPYADGDISDQYLPQDGLLMYRRNSNETGQFAHTIENTGLPERIGGVFRDGLRYAYAPGDAYTPLTRMLFTVPSDPEIDSLFAISDIVRSGSGFSVKLWRDFMREPGVKTLRTNYTLAFHNASQALIGPPYPRDWNVGFEDDWEFGGTFRFAGGLTRIPAGTPSITLRPGATLEIPAGTTAVLQGPPGYRYPVTAGVGARVVVGGHLVADSVAFTASNPSAGWGGLRFTAGSAGFLTDVLVDRVNRSTEPTLDPPPPVPSYAAVEFTGGGLQMNGVTIRNTTAANGLLVSGPDAIATVTNSTIEDNAGAGIVATGGAHLGLTGDDTRVQRNALGGVRAVGYGSYVEVEGEAQVVLNSAYGATAEGSGEVRVASPPDGTTSVSFNVGGLDARTGAFVDGGICGKYGCLHRPSQFEANVPSNPCGVSNPSGVCDARATGGSTVVAEYAYWGFGRTTEGDLAILAPRGNVVSVKPLAETPGGRPGGGGAAPSVALAENPEGDGEANEPAALRGADTAVGLASEARQAGAAGDAEDAFDLAVGALALDSTETDRAAVYHAAAGLLADPALAGAHADALVDSLEAEADGAGDAAPWARRALAVAYATDGDPAGSDALAVTLTADAAPGHRAFGHGQRVRLAVEAGRASADSTAALDRLGAFAAAVAETDSAGLDALASATALVVAAFPGAVAEGTPVGRGAGGPGAGAPAALADVTGATAAVGPLGLDVWPNPSAGDVAVRLAGGSVMSGSAEATVVVYDALGRRVAVLHDGAVPAGGLVVSLGGSRLPSGVYVVHARVTAGGAGAETLVRRVTVTR